MGLFGRICTAKNLVQALADEVAAATRPHHGRMRGTRGNIAAIPPAVEFRFTVHCESHLPGQNEVHGFRAMRVVGITCIRRILPDVGVRKAFALKLANEFVLSHC